MGAVRRLTLKLAALSGIMVFAAAALPAPAWGAMQFGNYELQISGRYDFHTWIWSVTPCPGGGCVHVIGIARPVAKAYSYTGDAPLANGQYTLTVDVPDGLRCGDIYYGPTIPTHDVYTWDAITLTGSLQSSFDVGCDGAPAGSHVYPFTLSLM
jgi:hypothetical protein